MQRLERTHIHRRDGEGYERQDQHGTGYLTVPVMAERFDRQGKRERILQELLTEHSLEIIINGVSVMQLTCTPQYLPELVLGRSLAAGYIRSAGDVEGLVFTAEGRQAVVTLKEGLPESEPYSCTTQYERTVPVRWTPDQVWRCVDHLAQDTLLHSRTHSAHSCFLLLGDEIVFEAEDIGRYNAVDKVLGWALSHRIDLVGTALFTSGRVSAGLVEKLLHVGVPILISKETATREAIRLADRCGSTLIGRARPDGFVVYTKENIIPFTERRKAVAGNAKSL